MSPASPLRCGLCRGIQECGWPVSRILYPFPSDDHSSSPAVADGIKLPTRVPDRSVPVWNPYSALLPVGLALPSLLPSPRWALTPPFHHDRARARTFVLCGAFPRVSPAGHYPAPLLRGVRTFLVNRSSRGHPAIRSKADSHLWPFRKGLPSQPF